jgi:DNA polymerase III subunit beta
VRFSATAGDLAAALGHVRRGAMVKSVPILSSVLTEVTDDGVIILTSHALDVCHTARCAATVSEPGIVAVSAAKLAALVAAMPKLAAVAFAREGDALSVRSGRSRSKLATMPVDHFPNPLTVGDDSASVTLTADDVDALLTTLADMAGKDDSRIHLNGVNLHRDAQGTLTAVSTNGHMMMRRASRIAAPDWPAITVPARSIDAIARVAKRGGAILRTNGRLLAADAADGSASFATKLIGEAFVDHARTIPSRAEATAVVETADLAAALARLAAASVSERAPTVGMTWGDGELQLVLAFEADIASDAIAARTTGQGCVAAAISYLDTVLTALGAPVLCLSVGAAAGAVLRIDAGDDVAIVAPVRWSGARRAAA